VLLLLATRQFPFLAPEAKKRRPERYRQALFKGVGQNGKYVGVSIKSPRNLMSRPKWELPDLNTPPGTENYLLSTLSVSLSLTDITAVA
jgi:hypothetical protein